ncbi:hypothetical protein L1987_51478 [Smallanthus sonchifolius]|uniref:Uncharacterized protein n=1 Tax=Smallanthus sonchifolius TaxID=185202 RepID=A0ACB9EQF9_9ASTR|nr:hypothetical protein L1987_51478 [Smallanthus sonchifolius]
MLMMDHLTHRGLARLAEKYGRIFRLKRGFSHTVAVLSPEMARQILRMGKLSVMKLFSRSVRDEVNSMVKSTAINSEYTKLFGAFNLAEFIPWLRFMDPNGLNTRLRTAPADLDHFIDKIVDDHLRNRKKIGDQNLNNDIVDEMLAFYSKEGKVNDDEDLHNAIMLTRDNIKAIIMDVMFGGLMLSNSWEDTDTFNLSRFMQDNNYEFLPFGSGRRSCPGMQLGLYAMEMALAHLLHWSKASNHTKQPAFEVCDSDPFSLENIIFKDDQQNKLHDSTCERTVGIINLVNTNHGDKDGEDESSLSKPPGFEGQRFEDMGHLLNKTSMMVVDWLLINNLVWREKFKGSHRSRKKKFRWRNMIRSQNHMGAR